MDWQNNRPRNSRRNYSSKFARRQCPGLFCFDAFLDEAVRTIRCNSPVSVICLWRDGSLVALIPTRGMERNVRLLWCRLVALWITGIWYSQEARSYSLALFLSMACTLAYVRLLTQPSMRDRSCMGVAWISGNPHALPFVVVSRLPRHWLFGGPSTCSGRRSFSSRFIAEKLPIW